ncbi:MAG: IPExxxVDY family protein [Crocinitomix sp.]|nr:IPExxxVDY family protein [Crocinitomix sp.]
MAKHKLILEDDFSFELIGICSSNADYRLTWGINKALSIALHKDEDLNIYVKKEGDHLYSFYSYYDEFEHIEYYLVKNLSNNYRRLIPEKDQVDYFLLIKNNYTLEINDILASLKRIDSILTAFIFDPEELKSKGNLVF